MLLLFVMVGVCEGLGEIRVLVGDNKLRALADW